MKQQESLSKTEVGLWTKLQFHYEYVKLSVFLLVGFAVGYFVSNLSFLWTVLFMGGWGVNLLYGIYKIVSFRTQLPKQTKEKFDHDIFGED